MVIQWYVFEFVWRAMVFDDGLVQCIIFILVDVSQEFWRIVQNFMLWFFILQGLEGVIEDFVV